MYRHRFALMATIISASLTGCAQTIAKIPAEVTAPKKALRTAGFGLGTLSQEDLDEARQYGQKTPDVIPDETASEVSFPQNFKWGAATAAHQVEGGLDNDWSDFERIPGNIKHGDTSAVGVDHYNRFDQDFTLAAAMGHNAHRLSIEWSRLEPTRGQYNQEAEEALRVMANLAKGHALAYHALH